MKQIVAIIAFFAITILSTDSAFAQANDFAALAKKQTHEISQVVKMNGEKQRAIYSAYMIKERKMFALNKTADKNNTSKKDAIMAELKGKIKSVLNETEYKAYEAYLSKNKKG